MPEDRVVEPSVVQIWENLPSSNKALSIGFIVMYMFTLVFSIGLIGVVPWYVTIGFVVWPMVVIAWLVAIWALFAIISVASVLFQGKIDTKTAKSEWAMRIAKTIIFAPTVIGSAIAVVEAFAAEIFNQED